MSKYIGTPVVNVSVDTVDVTGDITTTDTTPEVIIVNNTHEDTDGGREGKVTFKGQQSGGEETTLAQIQASHDGTSDDEKGDLIFKTNDGSDGASPTERMRIDSSGNVGIGVSDPSSYYAENLVVKALAEGGITIRSNATTDTNYIMFADGTTGTAAYRGYIGYAHNSPEHLNVVSSGYTRFYTGDPTTERMRIDSSGVVLVGMTSANGVGATPSDVNGTEIGRGYINLNRDDTATVRHIQFGSNGLGRACIGTNSSDLFIGTADTTLFFSDSADVIGPSGVNGATRDNAIDLGNSSNRFDDIFATNGTIQTSDEREKQQIASLTGAEITAAKAISKLFKTFKWNDSVAENGDNARTHTGVIAQQVEQAMTDAGLDAGNYAFFISTTWWETQTEVAAVEADEENGIEAQEAYTRTDQYYTSEEAPEGATERNRKGIRYPELLAFIGAATEQRLTSIEARLDALEGE